MDENALPFDPWSYVEPTDLSKLECVVTDEPSLGSVDVWVGIEGTPFLMGPRGSTAEEALRGALRLVTRMSVVLTDRYLQEIGRLPATEVKP